MVVPSLKVGRLGFADRAGRASPRAAFASRPFGDHHLRGGGWQRFRRGEVPLEFLGTYLCADGDGRLFRRMLTAGVEKGEWDQVGWILHHSDIPKPPCVSRYFRDTNIASIPPFHPAANTAEGLHDHA